MRRARLDGALRASHQRDGGGAVQARAGEVQVLGIAVAAVDQPQAGAALEVHPLALGTGEERIKHRDVERLGGDHRQRQPLFKRLFTQSGPEHTFQICDGYIKLWERMCYSPSTSSLRSSLPKLTSLRLRWSACPKGIDMSE